MWNNAVYLPENLMVYINFPKSIRNRGSFTIFAQFLQRVYFFLICLSALMCVVSAFCVDVMPEGFRYEVRQTLLYL